MIVDKLHKREVVRVLQPDIPDREIFTVGDAKTNAMLVTWKLLKKLNLKPDDELTVDVRILVERSEKKNKMGKCC